MIIINKVKLFYPHSNFFTMSSKFLAELSSDYEKLLGAEIGYDVIIYAGDEQNFKEIHAHSNILSIRSQYFAPHFLMNGLRKIMEIYFQKTEYSSSLI